MEEGESEEHQKNLIKPFFRNTNFEEDYYINTKERQDLAIHNGKTHKSSVGGMIEVKRPSNNAETINGDDLNRKAFSQIHPQQHGIGCICDHAQSRVWHYANHWF